MGFSRRFEWGLAWRTLLLVAAIWLLVQAIDTPGLRAGRLLAGAAALAALAYLWAFIQRTNQQVSRFVDSLRFEDFSQRFSDSSGAGFNALGDALDQALKTLQTQRDRGSEDSRYLEAVVDDTPGALVAIDADDRVTLLNKGARQMFASDGVTEAADLDRFGPELAAAIRLPHGTRKITRMVIDGAPQKVLFASSHVARIEGGVTMLSILPVQSELGALELAAQADLVRVLTHEIMNSLTPVTSLARTGADMVAAAAADPSRLPDAQLATETVARRSEGILRFVESYREFARSPQVARQRFAARPWAEEILRLALANAGTDAIAASIAIEPAELTVEADPELLSQALLNLLRNAFRAVGGREDPQVVLAMTRQRGAQCRIEVRDNGPGIPADRREDIFLPFYTTHRGGSGVGLSFARQVALAHGGSISATTAPEGGACLQMVV